jgi:hypothetical protein
VAELEVKNEYSGLAPAGQVAVASTPTVAPAATGLGPVDTDTPVQAATPPILMLVEICAWGTV